MKKLLGIMIALLIFAAPLAMYAQVEAIAGSLKIGVHLDTSYRWSGEAKKHPKVYSDGKQDIHWAGYDSVNVGDVALELTGKVGDRISFKILESLVRDTIFADMGSPMPGAPLTADIHNQPDTTATTLEAYIDIKIIDQLKIRVGEQLTPTLLCNTLIHESRVIHTLNAPLIANRSVGFNQVLSPVNTKIPIPDSVTGAAIIASFSGAEISYTWFDSWILPVDAVNSLYDSNKTKGGNVAIGYAGEVGPGKLAARGFYFDEDTEVSGIGTGGFMDLSGYGLGVSYTHPNLFVALEYLNATGKLEKALATPGAKNDNNWWGMYFTLAGKFSGIEPVYRLDYITYTNWNDKTNGGAYPTITSFDTEMWNTIGVNY